jgi:4'-phosphopantetheinyl transferase
MLEIFCCELSAVDADLLASYRDLLSPDECARLAAFRRERAAQTYLVSRALLRSVLAEKLNRAPQSLQFARDANDKPQLVGYPLHFNVSHSEAWIALAVGAAAVGIDVETSDRRNNILGIAKRYFPRAEFELLSAMPEPERAQKFCELWTVKEACVKWSGLGIGLAIAGVGVAIDAGRIALDLRADVAAFGAARAQLFALTPHIRLAAVSANIDDCLLQQRVPLGAYAPLPHALLARS